MPDSNTIMLIRPDHCELRGSDVCPQGYYALEHVIQALATLSSSLNPNLNIIDVAGENAVKNVVTAKINENDPFIIISFGHGNQYVYTAQDVMPVFTEDNIDLLAGRIWHALSCLVGKGLGKDMVASGGLIFSGYIEEWHWFVDPEHPEHYNEDPYIDKYAKGFYASDNQIAITLALTLNPEKAKEEGMKVYNAWIDYWYNSDDQYASEAIKWLVWDRDAYVYYTPEMIHIAHPSAAPVLLMSFPVILGLALTYKPEIVSSR